jgi:hypothetical protein
MLRHVFVLVLLLPCWTGCGTTGDIKDYIPSDELARRALTTALDAWKSGKTPDQIGASKPAINVQDTQWSAGKKLTAYEFVGPATGEDQNRRYTVRLTVEGTSTPQETTYVVSGKDPLWVFSAESYQRLSGM